MAAAVTAWSPVIMRTWMPALLHLAMATLASARGGSTMPTIASRVRSFTSSIKLPLGSKVCGSKSRRATTITRSPALAMRSFSSSASGAVLVGDRLRLAIRQPERTAARDQDIGRALDEAAHDRLALLVGHVVEGRHELVVRIEGHLGHAWIRRARAVQVDAALGRQHNQRALGRVADQRSRHPGGRRRRAPSADR